MAESIAWTTRSESVGSHSLGRAFENSYADLPARFYTATVPAAVTAPQLIAFNHELAGELGLPPDLEPSVLAAVLSGKVPATGSRPIAMAYAGHQFGHFVPQLGDGRAILLGELRDLQGRLRDVHLKGAGRTVYSRGGDGRAALGPALREYVVSEAMHALRIPTTRALALLTTGDEVLRERPLPGAILARVASSHVRVGTFQYFAARGDAQATGLLANYVIERHFPDVAGAENPYLELLRRVVRRQAELVAHWMTVGFIHGVMNTDNMTVSGETIDFGPCAFMDEYDPATVFSSIDAQGRYAYGNQPAAAQWNLARLAETLLPLIDTDSDRAVALATEVVEEFMREYRSQWLARMRGKLGLVTAEAADEALIQDLLDLMHRGLHDFTLTFRQLCAVADPQGVGSTLDATWLARWQARLLRDPRLPQERSAAMRAVNPAFIARNHRVEAAIRAAVDGGDFSLFKTLQQVLANPYDSQPAFADYEKAPQPAERVWQTFCGT